MLYLTVSSLDKQFQTEIYARLGSDNNFPLFPRTIAEFQQVIDTWIIDIEADIKKHGMVLESLKTNTPNIWSYYDFLYFSAITQFTIGYGDILPNSTTVRLVVVLQACLSAMLLVVFINIVDSEWFDIVVNLN